MVKLKKCLNERIRTETKMKRKIEIIRCLMRQIRFALISPSDLVTKVQSVNKLMLNDKQLRNLILRALNYHVLPNRQAAKTSFLSMQQNIDASSNEIGFNLKMRSPIKSILTIGGREINPTPSLHDGCYLLSEYCEANDPTPKAQSVSASVTILVFHCFILC